MISQLLVVGIGLGALYALVGISLNLVYGTMRLLNVGHGDLVMVGALVGYGVVAGLGLPPLVGVAVATVASGCLGFTLFRTLFVGLLRRLSPDGLESASLLIFFGLSMVLQNSLAWWLTGTPRAYDRYQDIVSFGDVAVTESRLVALASSAVLVTAVIAYLRFSIWGVGIRALLQSREAAAIVGIDVERAFMLSCIVGFALAGAAGAIIGMQQAATPFMGGPYTTIAFLIVVVGGLGNIAASLLCGLAIGLLETLGTALVGPSNRDLLVYGAFIFLLLLRPQGLSHGTTTR
jgi:branched-chain amino acid transport system permease protein